MKCTLCNQKRAKRFCPALNSSICASCCGQKRILEIDCVEGCSYLKAGRSKDFEDHLKRYQSLDRTGVDKVRRVIEDYGNVVTALEHQLARARLLYRDLTDEDAARATQALLETYRTEENGILYERTLDDPKLESLRRELKQVIESFRNPAGEENKGIVDISDVRLPLGGAIECLEYILLMIQLSQNKNSSILNYVDFLARSKPREEKRSSLIIPESFEV